MFGLRFFKTIFILLLTLAAVHRFALSNALYVLVPHLDTFMHALAGFIVALATISFVEKVCFRYVKNAADVKLFVLVLLAITVIGVGWEIFEKMIGFTSYLDVEDTTIDLIADLGGALLGYGLYRFIKW